MPKLFSLLGSIILFGALAGSPPAQAQTWLTVDDAWARATVPQQKVSGAFMRLTAQRDARLVKADSPVAGVVEIHEMKMDGDVMRMRPVNGLELPARRAVELRPGGYHLMLMELKQPLTAGQTISLQLTLEDRDGKRQQIEIQAQVRGMNGGSAAHPMPHKH
jgi:copper(I)-binding protein